MNHYMSGWRCQVTTIVLAVISMLADTTPVPAETVTKFLQVAEILQIEYLEGPNFRIDPQVVNDGLVNTYRLETKYGIMTVEGTPLLLEMLNELHALNHIEKLEGSEIYQTALKEGIKSPLRGAEALIDDPVGTVKGAAQGVGRWLNDVGRSISSKDPHQAGVAKTAFGQAAAKRAFAYDFRVDPYTRSPIRSPDSEEGINWRQAGLTGSANTVCRNSPSRNRA